MEHTEDGRTWECDNGRYDTGVGWRECPACAEAAADARWELAEDRRSEWAVRFPYGDPWDPNDDWRARHGG